MARQNPLRLTSVGVRPFDVRLTAFVISAMIAGLAGALYADLNRFVSPTMLSWHLSGELIVFVILGGVGRLCGPVVGAALYVLLEHQLGQLTEYWQLPARHHPAARRALRPRRRHRPRRREARPMPEPILEIERPREVLRRPQGDQRRHPRPLPRRDPRADRPERRRQVDADQADRRRDPPRRRHHPPSRARPIDGLDAAARARLGLARTFQVSLVAPEMSALKNVMLAVEAASGRVFRFFRPVSRDAGADRGRAWRLPRRRRPRRARQRPRRRPQPRRAPPARVRHRAGACSPKVFLHRRADGRPRPDGSKRMTAFLDKLRRDGADPADRARHGGGLRARRPHLGAGLRPGHRHRHRRRDPRATRRSAPPTSGTKPHDDRS